MIVKLTITNAKYKKGVGTDTISCVSCEIDGQKSYVPISLDNTHYAEIKRQVDAGKLTIEDAD